MHPEHPRPEAGAEAKPFPLLCAHRGIPSVCPENTLASFGAALGIPEVSEIELDVWLSRDGVPVVCHDPRLERTTDGSGIITEKTWGEIRSADAGCRLSEDWAGVGVPRLEEVLALAGTRVSVNIHVKAPGPDGALVALIGRELSRRRLSNHAYIAGDEDVLAVARDRCPEIARCCLAHQDVPGRMVDAATAFGCRRVQFPRSVGADDIARAKDNGLVCNLFYSNEPEDARKYLALGIDVILTDRAHALARLFRDGAA